MNAETLHAIAIAVRDELGSTAAVPLMTDLLDALTNQVNAPQDPGPQQVVSDRLTQLRTNLAGASSNGFSSTWRDYLLEMDIDDLLGDGLRSALDEVFARNQITPSVARSEVEILSSRLNSMSADVTQLIASLERLHISATVLQPGSFEVDILIPRSLVNNALGELGQEFEEVAKLLGPLSELATGSRPALEITSISSSDFFVIIKAIPEIASVVSIALKGIAFVYRKVQKIRQTQASQIASGLPDAIIAATEEYATNQIRVGLSELTDSLVQQHRENLIGTGREFEITMELTQSLETLAYKLDHNMRITMRATPPEIQVVTGEDGIERPTPEMEIYTTTMEAAREVESLDLTGEPILILPPSANDPTRHPESGSES